MSVYESLVVIVVGVSVFLVLADVRQKD
jgi:hypothetical protein